MKLQYLFYVLSNRKKNTRTGTNEDSRQDDGHYFEFVFISRCSDFVELK